MTILKALSPSTSMRLVDDIRRSSRTHIVCVAGANFSTSIGAVAFCCTLSFPEEYIKSYTPGEQITGNPNWAVEEWCSLTLAVELEGPSEDDALVSELWLLDG